jgi:hypothetical protein
LGFGLMTQYDSIHSYSINIQSNVFMDYCVSINRLAELRATYFFFVSYFFLDSILCSTLSFFIQPIKSFCYAYERNCSSPSYTEVAVGGSGTGSGQIERVNLIFRRNQVGPDRVRVGSGWVNLYVMFF